MFVMLSPFEILDYRLWAIECQPKPSEASDDMYPPRAGQGTPTRKLTIG